MRGGTWRLVVLLGVGVVGLVAGHTVATSTISWQDAAEHVGELVAVEGDVVDASVEPGSLILRFSTDPDAFHVALVLPMFSDLPRRPERLYLGKRVRASGTIRRFAGRPEMVLRTPDAIEVIGVASEPVAGTGVPGAGTSAGPAPPPTTPPRAASPPSAPPGVPAATAPSPAPAASPPVAAAPPAATTGAPPAAPGVPTTAPAPALAAPRAAPPATAPAAATAAVETTVPATAGQEAEEETAPSPLDVFDPCVRARRRWQDAADDARARIATLDACLARGAAGCRPAAAAVAPALSALEWAEQAVEDACP